MLPSMRSWMRRSLSSRAERHPSIRPIMRMTKSLGILVLAPMVLVFLALAASPVAARTEIFLSAVQFGLIGIARAQTARLSIINLLPTDPEFLPNPCDGIVPTFEVYVTFTGPTMVFYESRLPRSRRS